MHRPARRRSTEAIRAYDALAVHRAEAVVEAMSSSYSFHCVRAAREHMEVMVRDRGYCPQLAGLFIARVAYHLRPSRVENGVADLICQLIELMIEPKTVDRS